MKRLLRLLHALLLALGTLTLLVTVTPVTSWIAHSLAGRFDNPSGRLLIVLSGSPSLDGVLSESSHLRCVYAVRAWREGHFEKVWISGQGSAAMRSFLASQGIPAAQIDIDEAARNTRDSALHAVNVVRASSPAVLLTSDYHMHRALRAFRRAGASVTPMPIPDAYKRSTHLYLRWGVFVEETVELAKIAGYRWKSWI